MTTEASQAGRDAYWNGVDYVPSCYSHGEERDSYVAGYQAAEAEDDDDDDWDDDDDDWDDDDDDWDDDDRSRDRGGR